MHIAFLDANTDDSDFGRSHPGECDKFRALLAPHAPDWRLSDHKVPAGQLPQSLDGVDGIMISGSVASVNDPDAWVGDLLALIRRAVAAGVPVFGACFGHQAVAKALGGQVGPNPQGWVLGRYQTANHSPAPWMHDARPDMALHAAHKEQVIALPPGASVHAGTPEVPHGHLSVGPRVFTTQYHPELGRAFMQGLCEALDGTVAPPVLDRARASLTAGPVDDAQMARWIVAFFDQARAD